MFLFFVSESSIISIGIKGIKLIHKGFLHHKNLKLPIPIQSLLFVFIISFTFVFFILAPRLLCYHVSESCEDSSPVPESPLTSESNFNFPYHYRIHSQSSLNLLTCIISSSQIQHSPFLLCLHMFHSLFG